MAIKRPEPELLRNIPLKFVRARVSGHGRKSVDHQIPLIPFIDFLIVLVIFLLMSFSASGELVAQQPTITMPDADNTQQIEISPIIAVDERVITLDGSRVADTQTQGQSAQVDRIEPLIQGLEAEKRKWEMIHPSEPFAGQVIVQADRNIDFRVVKKVMFSAASAGYGNVSFAVNQREQ
ncbi:MAG: biopolymer transporter ExbD [Deltaproteobacteria bacterium]|nr:biopolymer transporter ExbD [Deltaproteobacteria bacterium]MBW2211373.1 biopolymer transporter ExbD [Deltaproteobacteria bacterium]MBW2628434.1 biopolymer transporter ExbD [Deltaproteobacteria bacterium]